MKSGKFKTILGHSIAFIVSAIALTLIQAHFGFSGLAWVSMVPFIWACGVKKNSKELYLAAYVVSVVYWLGNIYWLGFVTVLGWLILCFYLGLLWPVLVFAFRFARSKRIPYFLAAPILIVAAEHLQGLFLDGFFWRYLAHSQYKNIVLIQIADIFGAGGVSFLIAMVNGFIADVIISKKNRILNFGNIVGGGIVLSLTAGAIIYGQWRINQTAEHVEEGPLVASIQSNVPQSVKESYQASDEILSELLKYSYESSSSSPALVVWPETMVQGVLDERLLGLLSPSTSHRIFDSEIKEYSSQGSYVLVGATGGKPEVSDDGSIKLVEKYNAAYLYTPDGRQAAKYYKKIHLVPFGEVIPFGKSAPWLHRFLMLFTPYDYDYTLNYGEEYTVFEMVGGKEKDRVYKFGVMICYEDAVPKIAKNFTVGRGGQKGVDWLLNISNDGWFVRFKEDKVLASTELAEHTAVCVFRAVENRVAVVRSVNAGISCLIDSVGRIRDGFFAGSLPEKAMSRQGVGGWFADKVPIDNRRTFFSRYGQWLDFSCTGGLILFIIAGVVSSKSQRKVK
ncbi:MAG: apolipoprotein N-acyltransferase [Planctomycetes bacterium]|nr:apolipoprotein N-acyltransferase [Planctomycetota bacterium]